jgi:hypothetical protein
VTPDMAFECLLVSRDPSVVRVMNRLLDDLSITTDICVTQARALDQIADGSADLIVVDWEDDSVEFLHEVKTVRAWQRPTVVAVAASRFDVQGADVLLRKPLTVESSARSLRVAYSRMMYEHRRHTRHPVLSAIRATDDNGRSLDAMITDIGDGGVGLRTSEKLNIGETWSFRLLLPGAERAIYIQARVQWTRPNGAVGCEFLRIPPVDLTIMHEWLSGKSEVKKPLIQA